MATPISDAGYTETDRQTDRQTPAERKSGSFTARRIVLAVGDDITNDHKKLSFRNLEVSTTDISFLNIRPGM